MTTNGTRVLALIPELMTLVRVQEALRMSGLTFVASETQAEFEAAFPTADVALVDLGNDALDIEAIAAASRTAGVLLIAFGRHTDLARLRAAKDAGADAVHPRGKFLEDPAALVRDALASRARI